MDAEGSVYLLSQAIDPSQEEETIWHLRLGQEQMDWRKSLAVFTLEITPVLPQKWSGGSQNRRVLRLAVWCVWTPACAFG